jgi:predicted Zn-dependent protease
VALGGLAARDGLGAQIERPRLALRIGAALLAAGLVVAAVIWPARRLAASLFLGRAQRALAGDRPEDAVRALGDLGRAARAEPRDFDVALRTAYAASRAGRPADAIAAAQRALAVEPDSPNGWEALARGRLEAGDPAAAAGAADHALALLHAYPGALYTRAAASRALGDDVAAARARAALAALAPADPQARWLLGRLDGR